MGNLPCVPRVVAAAFVAFTTGGGGNACTPAAATSGDPLKIWPKYCKTLGKKVGVSSSIQQMKKSPLLQGPGHVGIKQSHKPPHKPSQATTRGSAEMARMATNRSTKLRLGIVNVGPLPTHNYVTIMWRDIVHQHCFSCGGLYRSPTPRPTPTPTQPSLAIGGG